MVLDGGRWSAGSLSKVKGGKMAVSGAKSGHFRCHFHRSSYSSSCKRSKYKLFTWNPRLSISSNLPLHSPRHYLIVYLLLFTPDPNTKASLLNQALSSPKLIRPICYQTSLLDKVGPWTTHDLPMQVSLLIDLQLPASAFSFHKSYLRRPSHVFDQSVPSHIFVILFWSSMCVLSIWYVLPRQLMHSLRAKYFLTSVVPN